MAGELERLLVRIEADTAILRRELTRADKATATFSQNVDRSLSSLSKKSDAFAAQISRSLLRFGALFGTAQLGFKAFDVLTVASDINDLARNTALTTDSFQELSFAIERAGGSQEAFVKGGVRFARNMAELRANAGGFNQFLREAIPSLRDQLAATESQADAINVLSDAMSRLGNEEDRTLLAIKAFGKGGEDLVEIFGQGSAALKEHGQRARELGAIIKSDTLENLEKAADATRELGAALEGAFVTGVGNAWIGVKTLSQELTKLIALSPAAWKLMGYLGDASNVNPQPGGFAVGAAAASKVKPPTSLSLAKKPETIDNSGLDAINDLHSEMLQATGRYREAIYADMDAELARFRQMLAEKKITVEQFETARADLAAIAGAKIMETFKKEHEEFRAMMRELEAVFSNTFNDAFGQALDGGKVKWKDLAAEMTKDLAKLAVQLAVMKPLMDGLFGAGGAASTFFGGFGFGGARAAGGPVSGGKSYLVGERGPEIFTPGSSGRITPNHQIGGGGGTTVNNYIDARGADIGAAERVEAALERAQRSHRDPVAAVATHQRRFPTRRL